MAVRSALRASRPLTPWRYLAYISVRGWVDPGARMRLEGLGQSKKFNDHIGNQSRDLPACSIISQPTTLPRAPKVHRNVKFLITFYIKTKFQVSQLCLHGRKKNIRRSDSEKLTSWWRSKRERRWNTKNNTLASGRKRKKLQNFLFWCLVLLGLLTINNNKLILSKHVQLTHT
jgi:hypothetical protein